VLEIFAAAPFVMMPHQALTIRFGKSAIMDNSSRATILNLT
jgi:hypothetical protein